MTGHYSVGSDAVFNHLHELTAGDKVQITDTSGVIHVFNVVQTDDLPTSEIDMVHAITSIDVNKMGLNIMTCSGSIEPDGGFSRRTLVRLVEN